jgi:trigger factor
MKVETLTLAPCRMRVVVRADADETRPEYEKAMAVFTQHGRVSGFRPGKAPRAMIERQYRSAILDDVRSRLIRQFYPQAIESERLAVVAVLNLTDAVFTPETGLSFAVVVDVAPDFRLPSYKGIPVKDHRTAVSSEDVERQIAQIREALTRYEETPDAAVERGDMAQIDFAATCEGRPLSEIATGCPGLGTGRDLWVRADEPEMLPGLCLGLVGLKSGGTREMPVAFPADFREEAVRGRTAAYAVTVKSVRRRVAATDEEVLKTLNVASREQLQESVRKSLERQATERDQEAQRQEISAYLLRQTQFDLPASVVEEETNLSVRAMLNRITQRGATREDLEQNRDLILNTAASSAKDTVRLRYILARIAEAEKIGATDEEVDASVRRMAASYRTTPEQLRANLEQRHGIEAIRASIRAGKTLERLLAEAKVG